MTYGTRSLLQIPISWNRENTRNRNSFKTRKVFPNNMQALSLAFLKSQSNRHREEWRSEARHSRYCTDCDSRHVFKTKLLYIVLLLILYNKQHSICYATLEISHYAIPQTPKFLIKKINVVKGFADPRFGMDPIKFDSPPCYETISKSIVQSL